MNPGDGRRDGKDGDGEVRPFAAGSGTSGSGREAGVTEKEFNVA